MSKKNVVVLGAGSAGTTIVRALTKSLDLSRYDLILLNDRPYFVHLPAMARLATWDDPLGEKAFFDLAQVVPAGKGTFTVGKVVGVAEGAAGAGGELELEGGARIPYAALVVATGSRWPDFIQVPATAAERDAHLGGWHASFKGAEHVVVVGGGSVGIEVPARHPARAEAVGISFVLGNALDAAPGKVSGVTTRDGKSLPDADLVVHAFGAKPNTEILKGAFDDALTARAPSRSTSSLRSAATRRKQAAKANTHAAVAAANVVAFLAGKPLPKSYKGSPEMIMIPLGKSGGAAG
ncbi:FAD/NAD(P)-binding domain-containing protein [Epithele typhae]|uniref:FAD/NAD(P)-binding domain-containing protein n=1 Tax=Epithele typhae TaxID=378194 RepID=UPI002008DED0|nr:FAD/NAD(P)-binding domain-containing protein [Epithele typhae]KAH9932799.1 FAD/NAD(P)-binding domain-containing protein [Epithele typhae]